MYRLIDSGDFAKLEQVGPYRFVRPAAQAVWKPRLPASEWARVDAVFNRFSGGDGRWEVKNKRLPESWLIAIEGVRPESQADGHESAKGGLSMTIKMTDFGHLGIFPEQHRNWQRLADITRKGAQRLAGAAPQEGAAAGFQVLNLFAYTGGSTLATAGAGAHVVHLDASKTSVAWARENAQASGLGERPIRWIVEDVQRFIAREQRRGSRYHGVILDPPSYGRGARGESWKIEEMLPELLDGVRSLLADDFSFILLSAHSTGYTPVALTNLLRQVTADVAGSFDAQEMLVPEQDSPRSLPSGASCLFVRSGAEP